MKPENRVAIAAVLSVARNFVTRFALACRRGVVVYADVRMERSVNSFGDETKPGNEEIITIRIVYKEQP